MELNKSDLAWGGLVGGIIAYDILSDETMSERFDDYLEHPIGKYVAIGATAMIGYHLLNLAEHFGTPDPVTETAKFVTKTVEGMIHGESQV